VADRAITLTTVAEDIALVERLGVAANRAAGKGTSDSADGVRERGAAGCVAATKAAGTGGAEPHVGVLPLTGVDSLLCGCANTPNDAGAAVHELWSWAFLWLGGETPRALLDLLGPGLSGADQAKGTNPWPLERFPAAPGATL
jgi:hypothetical protein